jgi:uncharacterized membrane protein
MKKFKDFLARKNIEFSVKRYFIEALSGMAQGLFASLIIGLIIKTLGTQTALLFGDNFVSTLLVDIGVIAMSLMGAAIGVAVCYALKAPFLVICAGAVTGTMGAQLAAQQAPSSRRLSPANSARRSQRKRSSTSC